MRFQIAYYARSFEEAREQRQYIINVQRLVCPNAGPNMVISVEGTAFDPETLSCARVPLIHCACAISIRPQDKSEGTADVKISKLSVGLGNM